MIKFTDSKFEVDLISKIVKRAAKEGFGFDGMCLFMDIDACHSNGCPLELDRLFGAPRADFAHDVYGIHRHMDCRTGKLMDCFLPWTALPEMNVTNEAEFIKNL